MIKKETEKFLNMIPGKPSLEEVPKIILTDTVHVLQKALSA